MIRFENISKVYDDEHLAVDELTLEIGEGELVVLIGPSGCGKTTTLQMVNRIIEPTDGTIYVKGEDHSKANRVQLRRSMGYVIQEIGLFPHMTVGQNIAVVPDLQGWSADRKRERGRELMQLVGMDPDIYLDRFPRELSGGQQQRIGVLRALAVDPDILLMDEPFGALDPLTRDQLQAELTGLQERVQKTIVFVTHDMDEALKIADRIAIMRRGRLLQCDTPQEILENPVNDFVAEFIGTERRILNPLEIRVGDVMHGEVLAVRRSATLSDCLEIMKDAGSDYAAVTGPRGRFSGIITADSLRRAMDEAGGETPVGDTPLDTATVDEATSVMDAVHRLAETEPGMLAVLDDDECPSGVFSEGTLPKILVEDLWPIEAGNNHPSKAGGSR